MTINKNKPVLFTGITATGTLTIGHYLGVIQHLLNLQEDYQILLMIADLHALTTISSRRHNYSEKTKEIAAILHACGLKKENCTIFVQSEVSEHLELNHFLSSYCSIGRIENMIQYKEKSKNEMANLSLLSYPVLMASDILLYDADLVIVGKDQKQHLELTSYLAKKFNQGNGSCLKIPRLLIYEEGSKIMGLQNPLKKMSKSSNDYISLLDDYEELKRKIMKAETDSEGKIYYDNVKKPGISNLITIYSQLNSMQIKEVEDYFSTSSYEELKIKLLNTVELLLTKIRTNFASCYERTNATLIENNNQARKMARDKITAIKEKLGLWNGGHTSKAVN